MSDQPPAASPAEDEVLVPALLDDEQSNATESVESPGKLMRIGSMLKSLLEEVHQTELDEPSRERLKEIYETSVEELCASLSPDLQEELKRLAIPFDGQAAPTAAELRIAKAQLVGWLEGLFHGIQATLFAQQMAARQQLEQMRGQLPMGPPGQPGEDPTQGDRPGTYL